MVHSWTPLPCRPIWVWREYSDAGGQRNDILLWTGLHWTWKDAEGAMTHGQTSWQWHNDGGAIMMALSTSFSISELSNYAPQRPMCVEMISTTRWTGEIVFCCWHELINQVTGCSFNGRHIYGRCIPVFVPYSSLFWGINLYFHNYILNKLLHLMWKRPLVVMNPQWTTQLSSFVERVFNTF